MERILQQLLAWHAKRILTRFKPDVIGITGSVGKTSAKEAVLAVLKGHVRVRASEKNYNNELGVPLTIIGADPGGRNPFAWLLVFIKAWVVLLSWRKAYPQVLVLEMGADHPGDIKALTRLAPPHIGVVTAIGEYSPVHLEFFKGPEGVVKEKGKMIHAVKKSGIAILNGDDPAVAGMAKLTKGRVVKVGIGAKNHVRAKSLKLFSSFNDAVEESEVGSRFTLVTPVGDAEVFLPHVLGEHQIHSALIGAAVGLEYKMNVAEITEALSQFDAPRGRMHLIPGIKRTLLIDDTYNSSPVAARAALKVLADAKVKGRKIAVFGTMAELGTAMEKEHRALGRATARANVAQLIVTGLGGREIARAALKAGMKKDRIALFAKPEDAGLYLQEILNEGDLVLIKGSQSARMEKVTREVMAEPQRAAELLVRQSETWLRQ